MRTKNLLVHAGRGRAIATVLGALVAGSVFTPTISSATNFSQLNLRRSRVGQVWVASVNIQEHEASDVKRRKDMRMLVRVMLRDVVRAKPDVLLFQQIDRSTSKWLRNAFSDATGDRFVIAEGPARTPRSEKTSSVRRDDSAILVNASTSRVLASGKTQISQRAKWASRKPMTQMVPWAKVVERGKPSQRLSSIAASIHYPKHSAFVSREASQLQKERWSVALHENLNKKMRTAGVGDGRITVLGGDFNTQKCRVGTYDQDGTCREMGFWKRLTRLGYRDPINMTMMDQDIGTRPVIDFIFSRANIVEPRFNTAFGADEYFFYSDHGIGAGLLEDEDTTPPWPPEKGAWRFNDEGQPCLWRFAANQAGSDFGSGPKTWIISREVNGSGNWQEVEKVPLTGEPMQYTDEKIDALPDDELRYRVAATDRAGNISKWVTMRDFNGGGGPQCK